MTFGDENADQDRVERMVVNRRLDRGHHQGRDGERYEAMDALADDIPALREQLDYLDSGGMRRDLLDRLARAEREYVEVESWTPDPRLCGSMGTDDREAWKDAG